MKMKPLLLIVTFTWMCICNHHIASSQETSTSSFDWRAESDKRIQQHRMSDFTITCVDTDGNPLQNTDIQIQQTHSDFHFGTAVTSWIPQGESEEKYFQFIQENFNSVVAENSMKWYEIERRKNRRRYNNADRMIEFANANNLSVRGHCIFWAKPERNTAWVRDLSKEELQQKVEQHLTETVEHFKGILYAWDVNNEMLDGFFFQENLGDDIRAWMFKRAAEIDPDVPLFVNEYGIVGSDEKTQKYYELIQDLQEQGAPIGGIGIQDHSVQNYLGYIKGERGRSPEKVWERLDKLSELNLPIHLTEISCDTENETDRADALELLFRVGYSHPNVDAILMWGFWSERLWKGENAALVNEDWTVNEAGKRISQLLNQTWKTSLETKTSNTGKTTFNGYHGTYKITAHKADGSTIKGIIEFNKSKKSADLVLR